MIFQVFVGRREINGRHGAKYAVTDVSCQGVRASRCVWTFLYSIDRNQIKENVRVPGRRTDW
jgi:hypothetical protein